MRLACTVCGRTEFSVEEAAILSGGSAQGYGAHRLPRTQVVCENCGHVMSFAVAKLQES
ncbi:Hypothetical Protein RradSPS_0413 [Rubrobacter radiotolerans]|uniref:Uncharacterized protein n=1 Tax=Rubrobacter radiotolerans TaxID=42256 RepID=A0A023X0G8_RUBRA|nr:Hypothetical Protein RradSPS_0413 [Rubrobacter radiotolerans]SMC03075.1 conserved hypothetical protein [Rubrobacter radiotolerans DSM 5868]